MASKEHSSEDISADDNGSKWRHEINFAETTSCHGIGHIYSGRRIATKIFWIVAFLTTFSYLISQCYILIDDFLGYTTVTKIEKTSTVNDGMHFPSITFCNYNRLRKSALTEFNITDPELIQYLLTGFGSSTAFNANNRITNHAEKLEAQFQNMTAKHGITDFLSFVDYAGPKFENFIGLCYWNGVVDGADYGKSCTELGFFSPVFTEYGKCFTFNPNGSDFKQLLAGSIGGLVVTLNIESDEYTEPLIGGLLQEGVRFVVHPYNYPPSIESHGISVTPGYHTLAPISETRYTYQDHPWGDCVNLPLKYYSNYSDYACFIECQIDNIIEKCGCRPLALNIPAGGTFPNAPVCGPYEMLTCPVWDKIVEMAFDDTPCMESCHTGCWKTEYTTSLSYAGLAGKQAMSDLTARLNTTAEEYRKNTVSMQIYFNEMAYTTYDEQQSQTTSQLVSNIGGQFGLCIGASILTLCEVGEYILIKLESWFCPPEKQKRKVMQNRKKENAEDEKSTELTTC